MLTLKLITEETDRVIRGLEKKHFKGAKEAIDEVLAVDKKRREAQQQLDKNLSEAKKMAAQIGGLMKEGKKAEADAIKTQVSEMKETNKQLEDTMNQAQEEMTRLPPILAAISIERALFLSTSAIALIAISP